jgi:N,N'-diacetyllegionaminate synthase
VDELYQVGVSRFKIAGFEATDPRFVKYVASTKLPLIISAGIGVNVKKVHEILDWILDVNKEPNVTFLHCNNAYPTPYEDINLGQLKLLQQEQFKVPVKLGLSDHTEGILIPPIAVSLGASVIEKHYTLDRKLKGPDHAFAIEPDELHQMVRNIRRTESSMGTKKDVYTESEKYHKMARRSVVAKKMIDKGQLLSYSNITTKRPLFEGSIVANEYYDIIGKRSNTVIEEDQPIYWKDLTE